jgi:hypothetical protein
VRQYVLGLVQKGGSFGRQSDLALIAPQEKDSDLTFQIANLRTQARL